MSAETNDARAFLKAFRVSGQITKAAEAAKIDRTRHYRWLKNEKYAAAFKEAYNQVGDMLEEEAIRRAHDGVLEAVFYQGAPVGAIRVYSDGLMLKLLPRFKPEYRTHQAIEISGPQGGPIPVTNAGLATLTDAELDSLILAAQKLAAAATAEPHEPGGPPEGGDPEKETEN